MTATSHQSKKIILHATKQKSVTYLFFSLSTRQKTEPNRNALDTDITNNCIQQSKSEIWLGMLLFQYVYCTVWLVTKLKALDDAGCSKGEYLFAQFLKVHIMATIT